jgi:hypothetical protein
VRSKLAELEILADLREEVPNLLFSPERAGPRQLVFRTWDDPRAAVIDQLAQQTRDVAALKDL